MQTPTPSTTQPIQVNAAEILRSADLDSILSSYDPDIAENLRWFADQIIHHDWSWGVAGTNAGIAGSTLSKVYSGTYGAGLERTGERLAQYRALLEERAGVNNPDFIQTTAARELMAVCQKTAASRIVSLVYGKKGWGKTTVLQEYARQNNHGRTIYLRCPAGMPFHGFLRYCVQQLGRSAKLGGIMDMRDRIINRIQGRSTLVIVDELHEPFVTSRLDTCVRICEFLREVHDVTRVGMLLCGTDVLPRELREGRWAPALEQLTDRGNLEYVLPARLPAADLSLFCKHYGLKDRPTPEAAQVIRDTLRIHSLRRLIFIIQDGARAAANRGEAYDWSHFLAAHYALANLRNPDRD